MFKRKSEQNLVEIDGATYEKPTASQLIIILAVKANPEEPLAAIARQLNFTHHHVENVLRNFRQNLQSDNTLNAIKIAAALGLLSSKSEKTKKGVTATNGRTHVTRL